MPRTDRIQILVGAAPVDGTAGRDVLHQLRAHLRRGQRLERRIGRRRRSLVPAHRRLGSDVQRVRARGCLPVAIRRDSSRRGRSRKRSAEA